MASAALLEQDSPPCIAENPGRDDELPQKSLLLVLGDGFSERKRQRKPTLIVPRLETKMRALAAGLWARRNPSGTLLFSGGETWGPNITSEAEAMAWYLHRHMPDISADRIVLENESRTTEENLIKCRELIAQLPFPQQLRIFILVNRSRMLRVFDLCEKTDINPDDIFSAERIFLEAGGAYEIFAEKYSHSIRAQWDKVRELLITVLSCTEGGNAALHNMRDSQIRERAALYTGDTKGIHWTENCSGRRPLIIGSE